MALGPGPIRVDRCFDEALGSMSDDVYLSVRDAYGSAEYCSLRVEEELGGQGIDLVLSAEEVVYLIASLANKLATMTPVDGFVPH